MTIWALFTLFLISMVKFMFAPFGGPALKLDFAETYLSCISGATFSAAIFFFSANYFMKRARRRNKQKREQRLAMGLSIKIKKDFTRVNKFIVRTKRSIGIIGITFLAPLFLSVPLGSIIAAKFYGKNKNAFLLIFLGICINGIILTGITYLF